MWSSIIVYKYIGRTAAVFIRWQRRQPGTGVTSTQDVDGVCRVLWDRVAVQWSQQSLFLLPELSGVRICAAGKGESVRMVLDVLDAPNLWKAAGCWALLPNIYFRFLMRQPLKDYLHRSFRGTVQTALPGTIFYFLLIGFVCVPSSLVHAPVWLIIPCVIIRLLQLASLTAAKMCDSNGICWALVSFFWSLLLGLTKILCAQALPDLCLLEDSYFPHLDRIAVRRTQEKCPKLHTFLAAAVETGHELSLTMMGFNQTDLSKRSHVLSTSLYWLQAPYMQPRAWLPAQGMWAWASCSGCAESWISSLAGWAQVCQIGYSTLWAWAGTGACSS